MVVAPRADREMRSKLDYGQNSGVQPKAAIKSRCPRLSVLGA